MKELNAMNCMRSAGPFKSNSMNQMALANLMMAISRGGRVALKFAGYDIALGYAESRFDEDY